MIEYALESDLSDRIYSFTNDYNTGLFTRLAGFLDGVKACPLSKALIRLSGHYIIAARKKGYRSDVRKRGVRYMWRNKDKGTLKGTRGRRSVRIRRDRYKEEDRELVSDKRG